MKQVIIAKNPLIKNITGSDIEIYAPTNDGANIEMAGGKVHHIKIPFQVKVLSGGKLDLDFKISQKLAMHGVTLVGAYWDDSNINAYFATIDGIDVEVAPDVPVMVGTLVQVVSYRQVEGRFAGGVIDLDKSGDVMVLDETKEVKKGRKKK